MKTVCLILSFALQYGALARMHPPVLVPPGEYYGQGLQRTMSLLATSTPEQRDTVKVLFYGQSITEQAWSYTVANDLRTRFPNANLVITNRAIGGYGAEFLVHTAQSDLFPFYPDLIIFQVYGSLSSYEDLIRQIRERTTSEILLQTDHVTLNEELLEATDPAQAGSMSAAAWKSYVFLPRLASEYGAELADVRTGWKDYLAANTLDASALLRDHIHLNSHGDYVMAELVKPHLVHRPGQLETRWRDAARTYYVGEDILWRNGTLELDFQGNRVDVVFNPHASGAITNYIDDLPPSAHPGAYYFTRSSPAAGTWRPALFGMESEALPLVEEWTVTITSFNPATRQVQFELDGSRTGPDGAGDSAQRFVSNSGRVILEPYAWGGARSMWWTHPAEPGFQIKWSVAFQGLDRAEAPPPVGPGMESVATIIQGMPVGPHSLRIEGADDSSIAAVRVYNPAGIIVPGRTPLFSAVGVEGDMVNLKILGHGLFQLETRSIMHGSGVWQPIGETVSDPSVRVQASGKAAFFRLRKVE